MIRAFSIAVLIASTALGQRISGPGSLPDARVGADYSASIQTTGGQPPYTYSILSGNLPGGLSLSSGGDISGRPTNAGTFGFRVQVRDSRGNTDDRMFNIAVLAQPTITTTSLPGGRVGSPYSASLAATGGTAPYVWSIASGSLPAGLTLSAAGTITGTPTSAGNSSFTVRVTDATGGTATAAFEISVTAPVSVTTSSLPGGVAGAAYSASLSATGGTAPYTWSVSAGSLPAGLSLASNGTISGTPTAAGTSTFTARATDSLGQTATASLTISVAAGLSVTTSSLPSGTAGSPYSASLSATGGTAPYTWSVSAGSLPAGLTLAPNGAISGTPTATGTSNFTARATDANGATATASLSIAIGAGLSVTTSSLPNGTTGSAYSASLSASGGTAPYTWSVSAGSLPAGLTLASNGAISGTPTATGTSNFTARATDANGATATASLSITIGAGLSVTTSSLPNGTTGSEYSASLSATGGTAPYTWSVSAGSLPAGLTLASNGAISGTPTAAGTSNFTARATDANGATATASLSITVGAGLSVTTSSLPNGTTGSAYSASLSASGGTAPYTWSVSAGSLPAGLTLASNGAISGTPTATGSSNFTARATDANGATATASLTITVGAGLSVTTSSLPNGITGSAYSASLSATGGTAPYTWSVSAGSLPAGLTLASNGAISGTPTAAGTSNFTARATDANGAAATASLTITVGAGLSVTTSSLPNGTTGSAYSASLSASGGTAPYTWAVASGSLPAGLTLASNGAISGTPTATGTSNFTARATDANGATATTSLSITVGAGVTITTSSLPNGVTGAPYSAGLAASGGTGPYTWAVSSGALPAGLSLAPSGSISGTPTAPGTSSFGVRATDANGQSTTSTFQLVVSAGLSISSAAPPAGVTGTAYSTSFSATGGTPPYRWTIASGSLPSGLTLNTNGAVSGTPNTPGTFNFTVRATDAANGSATAELSIAISPGLSITTTSLAAGAVNSPYADTLAASGGTPPYRWSVASGNLPPGLSLQSSGAITGSPTAPGSFSFTAHVSDAAGQGASVPLSIAVAAGLSITNATPAQAILGTAFSLGLTASGGTPPYTWSIAEGSLPPGLTMNSSGVITGTPTTAGNYTASARVADSAGQSALASLQMNVITGLAITTVSLAPGTVNAEYSQSLSAAGGTTPYTWSVASGSLPAGLTLSSAGAIAGTPTTAGNSSFTARVTDGASRTSERQFTLQVSPLLSIGSCPAASASTGLPYTANLTPTGGTAPYVWSVSTGSLPSGVALNGSTGLITGTPVSGGTYSFTLQVRDAAGQTSSRACSIAVNSVLRIDTERLPDATTRANYLQVIAASGGTPPYRWSTSGGSLPPGLTLDTNSGTLSGAPTVAGRFSFTIGVVDQTGAGVDRSYVVTVAAGVTIPSCPTTMGSVGQRYSSTVTAAGGQMPYTWSIAGGTLPAGLTLAGDTGLLSGTPSAPGESNFTLRVTDASTASATRACTVAISSPLLITSETLPDGAANAPYSAAVAATGGNPPYVFTVPAGSLPTGLALNSSTGVISGSPAQTGAFAFTVRVTDAAHVTAERSYRVNIAAGFAISACPVGIASVGQPYSSAISVAGGTAARWSITSGSLPLGLTIDPVNGTVAGTPAEAGTSEFTVHAADQGGAESSRLCAIAVAPTQLTISGGASLPDALMNIAYDQPLVAAGGNEPYVWSLAAGSLPDGLTLLPEGRVTGTPTRTGSFAFTLRVTDGSQSATRDLVMAVLPAAAPTVSFGTLPETIAPAQQPRLALALDRSYPVALRGRVTLRFTPDPGLPDDRSILFVTGSRTVDFDVPAGTTQPVLAVPQLAMQTGTVAGTIDLTVQLFAGSTEITSSNPARRSVRVDRLAPVITAVRATQNGEAVEITVTGYSTSREVSAATFTFVPATGRLDNPEVVVSTADAARAWFQDSRSADFGGQFTFVQPFTIRGITLRELTVRLTNGQGTSAPGRVTF